MYINKGAVHLFIFMSSLARVSSFTTTFVGSFLRKNTCGVQQFKCHFSSGNAVPWDRSTRSSEQSKIRSNRFKKSRSSSDLSLEDGTSDGGDDRVDRPDRVYSSRRSRDDDIDHRQEKDYAPRHGRDDKNDQLDRNYSSRQFSRATTSNQRPDRSSGERTYRRKDEQSGRSDFGSRRSEPYNVARPIRNDFGSRRSEPHNNDRRTSFRSNSNSGSYNTYSDRNYIPSYDREEKTEPIYGYYEGDHLYGVTSVKLALTAGRRVIKELLVQSGMDLANKKDAKAAQQILDIAQEKNIPIREFSKHDLNMLSDNRPHQGFILRAQPLEFTSLTTLEPSQNYSCVLALDEVWDPQNFGALLRTAYFLRCDKVVVCSKNSAPLSATVSRASAGAMEVMQVYSADNMMKFLDKSKDNGWQVVGTDLSPKSVSLYEVPRVMPTILVLGNEGHGIRTNILRRCTHLVRLGQPLVGGAKSENEADTISDSLHESAPRSAQEGSHDADGTPTAVDTPVEVAMEVKEERRGRFARAIKRPVRVHLDLDSAEESDVQGADEAVDSLNVSVTGAIILHHFMASKAQ